MTDEKGDLIIRYSIPLATAIQTLLDQRLFMVSDSQYQALMDLLERPEQANDGRIIDPHKARCDLHAA